MEQEQIEMAIWAYIDGSCDEAEQRRVAALIASDVAWQTKYSELRAFNDELADSLEKEQPSMRFAKDVMEKVATTQIARPISKFINPMVIKSIAAYFILTIAVFMVYVLQFVNWSTPAKTVVDFSSLRFDHITDNVHLDRIFTSTTINVVLGCTVILGLLFLDSVLRKNKKAHA